MNANVFFVGDFSEFLALFEIMMIVSSAIALFLVAVLIYYVKFIKKVAESRFVRKSGPRARCPYCRTPVMPGWRYCPSCGREISSLWPRRAQRRQG